MLAPGEHRVQACLEGDRTAQRFAPILGAFYGRDRHHRLLRHWLRHLLENTNDALIGVSINPMHNLVHLAIGVFLILMTTRLSIPVAGGAVTGVGLLFIVALVIGVIAPTT